MQKCDNNNKSIPGRYGVDVALTRADDLDRKLVAECQNLTNVSVIDIGCGAGGQSLRLAQAGARVTGADIDDYDDAFEALRTTHGLTEEQLQFVVSDARDLKKYLACKKFDYCCLQRVIHYLPYAQALELLLILRVYVQKGLFVSVTGVESDIGINYMDKDTSVEKRFCILTTDDAETFSITQPVCLYTPEEFISLLQDAGWIIEECWVSAFGNSKAICR